MVKCSSVCPSVCPGALITVLFVCLVLFFTSHQQSFSYIGTCLPGLNYSTKLGLMCPAQGYDIVTNMRLEPAAPRSRVKHSTTELITAYVAVFGYNS